MTQPQPDLVDAYQAQTGAARAQLAGIIAALWRSLPDYRNTSMRDFIAQALPFVNGAISHMQDLTAAYLAAVNEANDGTGTPTAVKALDVSAVRGGVPAADVYGRPFHLVWRKLGDNKPLTQAVEAGEKRAVQLALTDVQLAKTQSSQQTLSRNRRVTGYRRVLEGPHSCALCVVAATRQYHKAELMPMHPACDCSVDPTYGDSKPIVLDDAMLEAAHAAVADMFGVDSTAAQRIRGAFKDNGDPVLYRDVLITHHHGELGPVLGVRGQAWTGPGDIAA